MVDQANNCMNACPSRPICTQTGWQENLILTSSPRLYSITGNQIMSGYRSFTNASGNSHLFLNSSVAIGLWQLVDADSWIISGLGFYSFYMYILLKSRQYFLSLKSLHPGGWSERTSLRNDRPLSISISTKRVMMYSVSRQCQSECASGHCSRGCPLGRRDTPPVN